MTPVLIVLAVLGIITVFTGIRIVPQAKVMVIERWGKFHREATSGLNIIIPWMDSPRPIEMRAANGRPIRTALVDLREQVMGFETVQVITHDNVAMEVGSVIYFQIVNSAKALYEIENLSLAIEQLTMTNLRNIMGGLTLDQTLTSRETVNAKLRGVLDEATEKWGVKVTRVELREIEPPAAIKDAMAKQMTAERERRAEVTKAEGDKAAAILQAEGEKISRVLRAEAERDSSIALAEGRKQAQILDANGKAEATRLVFDAINNARATPEVLAIRYLETLQDLGRGPNKIFVPYEATAVLGSIASLKDLFSGNVVAVPPPQPTETSMLTANQALGLPSAGNTTQPIPRPTRPPTR